jgi:hypothetical protein
MQNTVAMVVSDRQRAILNRIRETVAQKGITPEKVSPSFLRVAVLMDPAKSQYIFVVKKDVGSSLVHDRKLDPNDSFVITDLGIKLLAETPANPGTGILQTYPNVQVFPAVAGEVTHAHLNIFYNGSIEVKVNDVVYAPAIKTEGMLVVRTTQQSSATTFSERFLKDGTVELNPDITLNGSVKNEIALTVPTFAGLQIQHATAATRNYVVLDCLGFLIRGGSDLGSLNL